MVKGASSSGSSSASSSKLTVYSGPPAGGKISSPSNVLWSDVTDTVAKTIFKQPARRSTDYENRKRIIITCLAARGRMTHRQMFDLGVGPCFMWPDQDDEALVLKNLSSLLSRMVKSDLIIAEEEVKSEHETDGMQNSCMKRHLYSVKPTKPHPSTSNAFAASAPASAKTESDWRGVGYTITDASELRKVVYHYQKYTEPAAGGDFMHSMHIGDTGSGKTVLQCNILHYEYSIEVSVGSKQKGPITKRIVTSFNWKVRDSMQTAGVKGHGSHTEAAMKAMSGLQDCAVAKAWTSLAINQHDDNCQLAPFTDVDAESTVRFVTACIRNEAAIMHTMMWDDSNCTTKVDVLDGVVKSGDKKGEAKYKRVVVGPLKNKAFREAQKNGVRGKLRMVLLAHQFDDFVDKDMSWNDWGFGTVYISFKTTPNDAFFDKHLGKSSDALSLVSMWIALFTAKWDVKYGPGTGIKAWSMLKAMLKLEIEAKDTLVWYSQCELPENWLSAWESFVIIKGSTCRESAEAVNALAATSNPNATTLLDALSRRSAGPLFKEECLEQVADLSDVPSGDEGDY
jgi:hypothetical protein